MPAPLGLRGLQLELEPPAQLGSLPKRLLVSRGLVVAIVIMVILIRQVPSPWRELVDLGVTAGLAAGTLSVSWFAWRAARGHLPEIEADYPQGSPAS